MTPLLRRTAALFAFAAVLLSPALAAAGEVVPYTKQAFMDAQNAGKSIVLFVNASWCPYCLKQQPIVDSLARDKAFADTTVFVIDYDKDKQALRDFNVRTQSTLIAFKGKAERQRSTAITNADELRALFHSSL